MASYDAELLLAARELLKRRTGQKGKLPSARIRRSLSTTYYAIFHFILDEVGRHLVGTSNELRIRRRILARTISHKSVKQVFEKIRGGYVHDSVEAFLRPKGQAGGQVAPPRFVHTFASVFVDAQGKRHDADYDLNTPLSEKDARVMRLRVSRAIRGWRGASSPPDRDFKKALCALVLLRGQLRADP